MTITLPSPEIWTVKWKGRPFELEIKQLGLSYSYYFLFSPQAFAVVVYSAKSGGSQLLELNVSLKSIIWRFKKNTDI